MDNKPLFSIITPVYNVEKYIKSTLESIIESGFEDLEIVLVNDGSKDRSGDICKEFATRDSRIKYVEKENGGVASARNVGIDVATGQYLMFLDSDDMFRPGVFNRIKEAISEQECDIYQFGVNVFSETYSVERPIALKDVILSDKETKDMALAMLTANYVIPDFDGFINDIVGRTMTNAAVKASVVRDNQLRFFSFWNNEDDWIFAILCYKNAKSAYLIEDCYYRYRTVSTSLSNSRRYITDIYAKRKKSLAWIYTSIDEISSKPDDSRIIEYKGILQRKMLLYVLYNETATPRKISVIKAAKTVREAVCCERAEGFLNTITHGAGHIEKMLFFMITHNMIGLACLLNKYCFKKYR